MIDPIPFFDMRSELAPMRAEIDHAIARVLDSGVFIGGEEVSAFEAELAQRVGVARAVGTSSGSDALLAIAMALRLGPGDEVVTTPLSFFATAGAIARLGAKVVFADIDPRTLTLDPRAALAACTRRTRAIVSVNLFGRPAALPVTAIPIIEDSAQSISAGPVRGLAAALSFFPTKNLGGLGDAGAVVTNDIELADRVALLRSHGARPKYHHVELGGNFRLDALQAGVLRAKLGHLDAWTSARRAHAATYRRHLPPAVSVPADDPAHVYHQFVIEVAERDALRTHLRNRGIQTEVYYPEPLHLQPCFRDLGYGAGSMQHAERACAQLLALPIYPTMPVETPSRIAAEIARFYRTP